MTTEPETMTPTLEDYRPSIEQAFLHFFHTDHANAAIHLSAVRYSPITFKLAGAVASGDGPWVEGVEAAAASVMADVNQYPLDRGRIEAEGLA